MKYFDDDTKTEVTVNRDIESWLKDKDEINIEATVKEAICDYRSGAISLDDLSCIMGKFYFELMKDPDHPTDLESVLETGSDLAYSERFSNNFASQLREVLDFESKK